MNRKTTLIGAFLTITVILAYAPGGSSYAAPPAQSTLDDWPYRRPITIDNTANSDTLTDYQIEVVLSASNFDFTQTEPSGADLRFTDSDGATLLDHWIEAYDATLQMATIWVRVPEVPASSEKTIYLYYGNSTASDTSSGDATFEFFDDFENPASSEGYYALSEAQTVLAQDQGWEGTAPHNLSVVEYDQDGYQYWGYYGLQAGNGNVGLARSNDLATWEKYSANPLLSPGLDARWPSVIKVGDTFYMMVTLDYTADSYVALCTSTDGVNFSLVETVIAPEAGNRNQNPNLFYNPNDGEYYLYWFRRSGGLREIRARHAAAVEDLNIASDTVVLSSTSSMAAPNMMFFDGSYFLATESLQSEWTVEIYESTTSPLSGFTPLPDNPVLANGSACFFQHIFDTTLHTYYCKLTDTTWTVDYRTADLTVGRQEYPATLDPAKWTALGGTWQPITATQPDGSPGLVVEGTTSARQILRSTFSSQDYVVEAYGQLLSGRVWGLTVRATDPDNMYFSNLYEDLDGTDNLYLYRRIGGSGSRVGRTPVGTIDFNTWYKMTVAVHGTDFEVYIDDQLELQGTDSGLSAGSVGLLGEGGTAARFDEFVVRQYTDPKPSINVGSEEPTVINLTDFEAAADPGWRTPGKAVVLLMLIAVLVLSALALRWQGSRSSS